MVVVNLQVDQEHFLRVEDYFNDVLITLVKHDRDNTSFENIKAIIIPRKQLDNFISVLKNISNIPVSK